MLLVRIPTTALKIKAIKKLLLGKQKNIKGQKK
jgi:hypothetical protein